jgi:hypothetical protein
VDANTAMSSIPKICQSRNTCRNAQATCDQFGKGFRAITEVQSKFQSRPMPDEALCAVLWEYKERGKKGYDLTERLFTIVREQYSKLNIIGPERAGKDVILGKLKVIFLNDGPGLLLGSMWRDYSSIEDSWKGKVKVVTLRMFSERITMKWLLS